MNLRNRKSEKNKETLRRLAQKDGNKFCFDCATRGPLYVVTNYHILVCSTCSAAHRSFQHKVKGISMSEFTDEEVVGVSIGGNDRAAKIWLATFRGDRPRPNHDRSIFTFVEEVFERGAYKSNAELRALDEDITLELHPELRKPAQPSPGPAPAAPQAAPKPAEKPAPPPPPPPQQAPPQVAAPPPPAQRDIFDDIFGGPAQTAPSPPQPPQQSPPQQQQQQQQQQQWGPPSGAMGQAGAYPPSQLPPQWGAPPSGAVSQTSPQPQLQAAQAPPPSQLPNPIAGGRIRVLGVSSTTSSAQREPVRSEAPSMPPPQQWNQPPPQQWSQLPPQQWNQPQPLQHQPQPQPPQQQWGPPSSQPQQWGSYQQPGVPHPQSGMSNCNYMAGGAAGMNYFAAPQADPWGSGAPTMTTGPPPPPPEQTPAFDSRAFAGLNPF